jgi:K+ transporter
VLSAVEGLEVVSPAQTCDPDHLTLILLALFAVQKKHGTGGRIVFGPITLVQVLGHRPARCDADRR